MVFITFKNFGCKIATVTVLHPFLCIKIGSKWSLNRFYRGGGLYAPSHTVVDSLGAVGIGLNIKHCQSKYMKSSYSINGFLNIVFFSNLSDLCSKKVCKGDKAFKICFKSSVWEHIQTHNKSNVLRCKFLFSLDSLRQSIR